MLILDLMYQIIEHQKEDVLKTLLRVHGAKVRIFCELSPPSDLQNLQFILRIYKICNNSDNNSGTFPFICCQKTKKDYLCSINAKRIEAKHKKG